MKVKIIFYSGVLSLIFLLLNSKNLQSYNTKAGTTLTNKAEVEYNSTIKITNIITTNVIAIYGFESTKITQGNAVPGGIVNLTNYITNKANTTMTLVLNISNFNMKPGFSGSPWKVTVPNLTTKTLQGTNGGPIIITNVINYGAISSFILRIETSSDSLPGDWGEVPVNLNIIGGNPSFYVKYIGDNGNRYGGTNISVFHSRVTISGPFIVLRKVLSITNLPQYLANGGNPAIPVPDAIITYTNYYDNDGNAKATNLIIIDTIPEHTDFIVGSITNKSYTNSLGLKPNIEIRYDNGTGTFTYIPVGQGIWNTDPNVKKIRIRFLNLAVSPDNGDNFGIVDGALPDIDSGYFWYKVVVHKRLTK